MNSRLRTQRSSRCCSCPVQLLLHVEAKVHPAQGLQIQQQIERGKRLIYSVRQAHSRLIHHDMEAIAAVTANMTHFQLLVDSDKRRLSEVFFLSVMALVHMRVR